MISVKLSRIKKVLILILGLKFEKNRFPQKVIDCVASHHEDVPFTTLEAVVVYIADAVSGGRPGLDTKTLVNI